VPLPETWLTIDDSHGFKQAIAVVQAAITGFHMGYVFTID
jgi:hypothetical protein